MEAGTIDIDYKARFKDAEWVVEPMEIIIGGLGGIGNGVATELGKLGHKLHIFEMDTVEYLNCIPQGYAIDQIGKKKFDAFAQTLSRYVPNPQVFSEGKYEHDSIASEIMFSCFDNMQARKDMFNNWKNLEERQLFIDGRLLAEIFQVFVVYPGREQDYEAHLFDDSEVETEPCTYKQTSHIAKMLHGYMINLFNAWIVNKKQGVYVRELPFFSEYISPLNIWNYG